jgi:hypothetical protein
MCQTLTYIYLRLPRWYEGVLLGYCLFIETLHRIHIKQRWPVYQMIGRVRTFLRRCYYTSKINQFGIIMPLAQIGAP